jgi:hypothetical protein
MSDLKNIGRDLWENKPLLITVLVGLAIVAYMIYKQQGGSSALTTAAAATTAAAVAGSGGTFVQDPSYYGIGPAGPAGATGAQGAAGAAGLPGLPGQPPKAPVSVGQPTLGLLGPKVAIGKKNGVYTYKTPGGQSGFLSAVIPHGATVRGGAQGRYWYILNGLKYLITSGSGVAVLNNATDANAP